MNLKVGQADVLSRECVTSNNFYQEGGVAIFRGDLVIVAIGHTLLARQGAPLSGVLVRNFDETLVRRLRQRHPDARLPGNDAEHLRIIGALPVLASVPGPVDEEYWRFIGAASVQSF